MSPFHITALHGNALMLATSAYRENRAHFPLVELERWEGQWVAFSADGTRILAGAAELTDLVDQLGDASLNPSEVVFERIEFDAGETFMGGAEAL